MSVAAEKLSRLRELEREVRRLQAELYQGIVTPKLSWRGPIDLLQLECAGERLAVRLELVEEVVRMVALRRAPWGSSDLIGLVDFRGVPVPVLDLRARLGWGTTPIALTTLIAFFVAEGRRLALLIDKVIDVARVDGAQLESVDAAVIGRPGIEALLRDGERLVQVLQPFLLLRRDDLDSVDAALDARDERRASERPSRPPERERRSDTPPGQGAR